MIINSDKLIPILISELESLLAVATTAANDARDLATHEQSKPETQYDTVGLEASYLAHGQSQRVAELKLAIKQWQGLALRAKLPKNKVDFGCLVVIADEHDLESYYLVGPSSGGVKLHMEGQLVTVISKQAPLGKMLFNKQIDDDFSLTLNNAYQEFTIIDIR